MSYTQVLVGTDGSTTATRAVQHAAGIAATVGAPLLVVTAWQRDADDPPARSEEAQFPGGSAAAMDAQWAIDTTSDAAAVARQAGVDEVRQIQAIGAPVEALLESAATYPDGLLVVGTVGLDRRAERLVGNVPHQLTHHAPIDLLLCTHRGGPWRRAALATDGSQTAARAVERGLTLARATGAEPALLAVARTEERAEATLERVVANDPALADLPRRTVADTDTVRGLTAAGREHDLLVIGNKGMSGPSRLLGSVANRITHEVPTDLLLVNTTR